MKALQVADYRPQHMAPRHRMTPVTVRFPTSLLEALKEEADADGVSVAEFIREAATVRAVWAKTRRGEMPAAYEDLERAVRELRD